MTSIRRILTAAAFAATVAGGAVTASAAAESTYRMTGYGAVAMSDGDAVGFRVDLACPGEESGFDPQPDPPKEVGSDPPLEIGLPGATFVLEKVTSASCRMADDGGQHQGTGSGTCAGRPAQVAWTLTDARAGDEAHFDIRADAAECGLAAGGPLLEGGLDFIEAGSR